MKKRYSLTLAGEDHLTPLFKSAGKEAEQLTAQLRNQEQEARKLSRTQKDLSAYAAQKKELKALGGELAGAKQHTEKLAREIAASGVVTRKQQREFQRAKKRSDALAAAYDHQRQKNHQLGNALKAGGVNTARMDREQERLRLTAKRTTKELDKQRDSLKQLGAAQKRLDAADSRLSDLHGRAVGTAVMAAAAAIPVARAIQAESSMAEVAKVVDLGSEAEREKFQSDLHQQSAGQGKSFTEAAEIAAAAGQSGVEAGDLLSFTASATKMAVAFDMEARAAGETMADWRAGMKLSQEGVVQLADAVNHVSNNMNATAADISEVLKRQGSVATKSGLSAEQTASLAGALLSGGATSEVASTTMKNLLGALTKGSAASGSQQSALSALGFDAEALAGDMQTDAIGSITSVFDALADAPIEEQSALVSELFGEESKGGIMPLLTNLDLLQKSFGLTSDSAKYRGAMEREYAGLVATTGHQMTVAKQQFDRLLTVVGGSLLPVTGWLAEAAGDTAGWLADTAEQFEFATSAIVYAGTALVAYKAAHLALLYTRGKMNQMQARAQLSQAKLAAAEGQTATQATRAAAALARFNGVLGMTGMAGAGGAAGKSAKAGAPVKDSNWAKGQRRAKIGGTAGVLAGAGIVLAPMVMGGGDDDRTNAEKGRDLGGAGGALAGMAVGAALGSAIPIVGTVIGGAIGGIVGSVGGDWLGSELGEGIGGWFDEDQLPAPGENAISTGSRDVTLNSSINLEKAPAHINEEQVAQMVIDKQMAQIAPMLSGPGASLENSLEVSG